MTDKPKIQELEPTCGHEISVLQFRQALDAAMADFPEGTDFGKVPLLVMTQFSLDADGGGFESSPIVALDTFSATLEGELMPSKNIVIMTSLIFPESEEEMI